MTHRRDARGRGREIHPADTVRYRTYFTLAAVGMVLCGILPPLIPAFIIAAVLVVRAERRRRATRYPTYRDDMLERGRKDI